MLQAMAALLEEVCADTRDFFEGDHIVVDE
jgi:hypothetical protein